ncbi:PspA/IM30 family protein [Halomarina salina]|uniref:PspA/IM30 family protein n=1 Tax=Halomarina salina TaxID=1872699 RepID=A0ABD5RKB1_9EURY|nr:PspA/IM30 family protein [Halomarina salina]
MGLFDRTTEALEREVNRLLDDVEDPQESLDYTYERLRDELARVDEALVDLVTQRKRLEGERDRLEDRIADHNDRAREAVEEGDDARARDHLEDKRSDMGRLDDVDARIADLHDAESDLKSRRNELKERIERFRTERAELNARQSAASAEASVADALGQEGDGTADRRVADATDHVEESEARAAALEELRSEGFFDEEERQRLDAEQARVDAEVESELETLRSQVRGEDDVPDATADDADDADDADGPDDDADDAADPTDADDASTVPDDADDDES